MPRAPRKTAVKPTAAAPAEAPNFDASAVLAQLQALTKRVEVAEDENKRLQAALEEAKTTGSFTDELGNKVLILSEAQRSVNASIHDKPGTVSEKLDIMETQAKLRREPFDRERTRAILMGEDVPDLLLYICDRCGRGEEKWNTKPELFELHIEQHRTGKKAAYKGARKIRPVDEEDEEDDEAAERAVLARLSEKYGVVTAA